MFNIHIDISGALADQLNLQAELKGPAMSRAARKAALYVWGENLKRIHFKGLDITERPIFNGKYSEAYAKHRTKKGRNIDKVDLFMTGELKRSLQVAYDGNNWVVGFINEYGGRLRGYHEERQEESIWGVSERDEDFIQQIVENEINLAISAAK